MYGQQVTNVKETKMFGVIIDSKLNWTPHITQKLRLVKKTHDAPPTPMEDMGVLSQYIQDGFMKGYQYIYGLRNAPLGPSSDSESYKRLRGSLKAKLKLAIYVG
jgi:hypothetical protein